MTGTVWRAQWMGAYATGERRGGMHVITRDKQYALTFMQEGDCRAWCERASRGKVRWIPMMHSEGASGGVSGRKD